jgi:hypothetical protein
MKSQRINLLPPRETPKRDWLSLSMMGLYLGVGMGVLLLWMAWALYLNYSTKAQLDDAQKRLTELQVSTDGLQSALQNRKPDVRLIEQQAVYERRIEIKQSLINELIKVSRDNQTGFALAIPLLKHLTILLSLDNINDFTNFNCKTLVQDVFLIWDKHQNVSKNAG